jgi:hypothetical protein
MRRAGLVCDQVADAFSADSTALRASSAVAEAAFQHGVFEAGFMISKVVELDSSLPSTHNGTDTVVLFESGREEVMSAAAVVLKPPV